VTRRRSPDVTRPGRGAITRRGGLRTLYVIENLWMIPGEARVFPLAELDQAKAWVAGAA
jgi:hypothetical protein